jgi:xanthine dehydrogenase molybdopterin-binding subunit B
MLITQPSQAVPWNENGEMEVFSSTQNPSEIQGLVASVLGVAMNRINVRVKRLGVSNLYHLWPVL